MLGATQASVLGGGVKAVGPVVNQEYNNADGSCYGATSSPMPNSHLEIVGGVLRGRDFLAPANSGNGQVLTFNTNMARMLCEFTMFAPVITTPPNPNMYFGGNLGTIAAVKYFKSGSIHYLRIASHTEATLSTMYQSTVKPPDLMRFSVLMDATTKKVSVTSPDVALANNLNVSWTATSNEIKSVNPYMWLQASAFNPKDFWFDDIKVYTVPS